MTARTTEGDLLVLFAGNNDGVLAACGCPGNPSGGFAKRQGLIETYRARRPDALLLDAGNLLPDREHAVKVKYVAKAAARTRYDAIALGVAEFLYGSDRLREMRREHGLPLVCANVRDEKGLIGAPHVVVEKAGLKIGIFAVIQDFVYGWPPLEWREGLTIQDPVRVAGQQVAALADCDLVVALSHQELDQTRYLAEHVAGLDLVVAGHTEEILKEPEQARGALIVCASDAGSFLGALALKAGRGGYEAVRHDLTFLTARVPNAKWVVDLYWEYVAEAKVSAPPVWDAVEPARYDTAEACAPCHKAAYTQWKGTRHAHAYETLVKVGRQDDPECRLCHTMGAGREGGFVSMEKTPGLGRVTCQACHLVPAGHKAHDIHTTPEIEINSGLCMSCHGPVQSPDFDYHVYRPKIVHKGPRR